MTVICDGCGRAIVVPPDKVDIPNLRARCSCGHVFYVARAQRPPESAQQVPRPVPGSAPGGFRASAAPVPPVPPRPQRGVTPPSSAGPSVAQPTPLARPAAAPPAPSSPVTHGLNPAEAPAAVRAVPGPQSPAAAAPPIPPGPGSVVRPPEARPSQIAVAAAGSGSAAGTGTTSPPVATAGPQPGTVAPAGPKPGVAGLRPAPDWKWCRQHPQQAAANVCPQCLQGYCSACGQHVRNSTICPACDCLCVPAAQYMQRERHDEDRSRPLVKDFGTIISYPLRDPLAFVLLALFVWFFGLLAFYGALFSKGVLLLYAFHALSRVADGNLRDFTPDFSGIDDLIVPLRLSFAATVVSVGPLILAVVFWLWPLVSGFTGPSPDELPPQEIARLLQEEGGTGVLENETVGQGETPGPGETGVDTSPTPTFTPEGATIPVLGLLAGLVTALWAFLYAPVALIVAGLSRSVISTLNPLIGIDTIRRMGVVYLQALGFYFLLIIVPGLVGRVLGALPLVGGILAAFVDVYSSLAVGCTLGLAVYKKAPELDWD